MRSTSRTARSLVLAAVLCIPLASPAWAASRNDGPSPGDRDRVVRIIRQVLKTFGITINSDLITIPKP